MGRLASQEFALDPKLALAMSLRPVADVNTDLMLLARKEREQEEAARKEAAPKVGEFRIVPVTTTTVEGVSVEGIGKVATVQYSTIAYEVTQNGVSAENRAVWGQNISGFMTFQ